MTAIVPIESAKPAVEKSAAEKAAAEVRPARVGVLLVNLGTPDTADARGVRVYLKEFLSDPRVIEDQGLRWKLILNGIILRVRPGRKARDYLKIWNAEKNESPLKTITRAQSEKLAAAIADHDHVVVDWAMRYGNPSIASRIEALIAQGCDRILTVPLYPQYSAATSATVCDEVFRVFAGLRAQPTLRVTPPYYEDPGYIEALAVSIDAHLATLDFKPELIVASFHGMPQKYVDKGDPYQAQCVATTDALRKRMGMDASKLLLTFQSRFGFDAWLQPYTDKTMERLAKEGVRRIAVITPGFSADCLETLEEIAQENAEIFKHNGGEQFSFIPCLNDSDPGMDVIRQLVLRELQGWI
jgi:ferrochelatase